MTILYYICTWCFIFFLFFQKEEFVSNISCLVFVCFVLYFTFLTENGVSEKVKWSQCIWEYPRHTHDVYSTIFIFCFILIFFYCSLYIEWLFFHRFIYRNIFLTLSSVSNSWRVLRKHDRLKVKTSPPVQDPPPNAPLPRPPTPLPLALPLLLTLYTLIILEIFFI